jgi:hypothetical protein
MAPKPYHASHHGGPSGFHEHGTPAINVARVAETIEEGKLTEKYNARYPVGHPKHRGMF